MNPDLDNDSPLRSFKAELRERLGDRLRQLVLFGSRARGEFRPDSDYDMLVIVDRVDRALVHEIDAAVGRALLDFGVVFSAFPIGEQERADRKYSPFLMNASKEGVAV